MTKSEDKLASTMRVLKTATCPTLSGKSNLTYQIGATPDSVVHLRIAENSGGGFFSDEWIAFEAVQEALKKRPKGSPVMSHFITPVLKGKSVNTSAFLLAVLSHLKLLKPVPGKKRQHELLDPQPFLEQVTKLMSSSEKTKAPRKKTAKKTGGKAPAEKRSPASKKTV
jgi:hypothetical protein